MRNLIAALAFVVASTAPSQGALAAPRTHVVTVDAMKFGPMPAGVRSGDVIIWDNRDLFRHSATAANGSFDVDLPVGKKARFVVRRAGTFKLLCKYHPGMRAILRVAR